MITSRPLSADVKALVCEERLWAKGTLLVSKENEMDQNKECGVLRL